MTITSYDAYKCFFSAFSNKTKFEVIFLLRNGPKTVNEICKALRFEQSRVSHNLKRLEDMGFVTCRRVGKTKVYSLDKRYISPILKKMNKYMQSYGKTVCA
ncbi:MAG: ArsR/SmtB family transcription factor [Candidatus Nanoarchaeia archaeon]